MLAQVDPLCEQVEAWADETDDVPAIRDADARLMAIDAYLERTSTDGRARVGAARLRLKARIGDLIPATTGHPRSAGSRTAPETAGVTRRQLGDARKLATNRHIVEDVIEASTDEDPPTQAKAMRAIDAGKPTKPRQGRVKCPGCDGEGTVTAAESYRIEFALKAYRAPEHAQQPDRGEVHYETGCPTHGPAVVRKMNRRTSCRLCSWSEIEAG
jgi:hypothetical protein